LSKLCPHTLPTLIVSVFLFFGCEKPSFFSKKNRFTLVFDDALGLIRGGPVTVAGVQIGKIASIKAHQNKAIVDISIASDMHLYKNATGAIRAKTLLGEKVIALNPGDIAAGELSVGDTIKVDLPNIDINSVLRESYLSLRSFRHAVGLTDPENLQATKTQIHEGIKEFGQFFQNLKTVVSNMSSLDKRTIENWLNKEGVLIRLFPAS